jgi:HlyD family secretion protein
MILNDQKEDSSRSTEVVMKIWRIVILVALLAVLIGAFLYFNPTAEGEAAPLSASGTVEAESITVSPELSGRIMQVNVQKGDEVGEGDPLFTLDDGSLRIRRDQIEANGAAAIAAAKLQLIQAQQDLQALYDHAEIDAAQVQLQLANARDELDDAEYRWRVRQEGQRANPDTIAAAEARLTLAEDQVEAAEDAFDYASGDSQEALARVELTNAREARDAALRSLNWYKGKPSEIDQAILDGEIAAAQALIVDLEREWEKVKDGPDPAKVELAEAQINQAEANLKAAEANLRADLAAIDLELAKTVIAAPNSGAVMTLNINPGELIQAGGSAMTLSNLEELTLTVYIPENLYGQVQLGETVEISADSFPGQVFSGTVIRISDQAEFTPSNVQTPEERVKLVFAVEISVEEGLGDLKPGMPADVRFSP